MKNNMHQTNNREQGSTNCACSDEHARNILAQIHKTKEVLHAQNYAHVYYSINQSIKILFAFLYRYNEGLFLPPSYVAAVDGDFE